MHSQRRTALAAVVFGLAVVVSIPAPALAHARHATRHAANPPVRRHAAKPPRAPSGDAALSPYLPADDALADEAAGIAPDITAEVPPPTPHHRPSGVAGELARWVAASGDNGDLSFMIVDKLGAYVYAFDASGRFLGSAPILIGLARGDDSAPGIGGMKLAQISDDERTTPAGRFVTRFGDSDGHGKMLWVDIADAISMHPVMSVNAGEHRLQRIKSTDPDDHRISYGCINVPKTFYDGVVTPALADGHAVVYVLPDTKPVDDVFPAFAAANRVADEDAPRHRPRHYSSADLLADSPDRIPDPQPTRLDRVSDRMWRQPPM